MENSTREASSGINTLIGSSVKGKRLPRGRRAGFARRAVGTLVWAGPKIAKIGPLRRSLVKKWEKQTRESSWADVKSGKKTPGSRPRPDGDERGDPKDRGARPG